MGWGIVYPPYSVINMGVVQPPTPTTRWVYNFNVVDSHIDLNQTITYTGDFYIILRYECQDKSVASIQTLVGGSGANILGFWLDDTFRVYFNNALVVSINKSLVPQSGILNLSRASGNVSLKIDGVEIGAGASDYDFVVSYLARAGSGNLFGGKIYDYQDSLGNNFPINDRTFGLGAPIVNSAATLGSELWNYVTSNASGSVSKIGNNSYHYNITSGESAVVRMINAVAPSDTDTYLIEFEVYDYVAGGVAWNSDGFINLGVNKNGKYKFLLKSKVADLNFSRVGSVCNLKLQNISIKQANGYATGVNLLESGWQEINI